MTEVLNKLPTVLLMGALVMVFGALRKQNPSLRFRFWMLGWVVIFVRYFAQMVTLSLDPSIRPSFLRTLDYSMLLLGSVIFMTSVSAVLSHKYLRWSYIATYSLPMLAYSLLMNSQVEVGWPYAVCLFALTASAIVHGYLAYGRRLYSHGVAAVCALLGGISIFFAFFDRMDIGFFMVMSAVEAFTGVLFYRAYRRFSPGVVTTSLGFFLWASITPLIYWSQSWSVPIAMNSELWNVPKYLVGIGMIVTLLEEQHFLAENSRKREQLLNAQMRRFADVTSRLLSGVDVPSFCMRIADTIAQASNYQRAVVLLVDEQRLLYIAGHAGVAPDEVRQIENAVKSMTAERFEQICADSRHIGMNSYLTTTAAMSELGSVPTRLRFEENPNWKAGDELLVPLRSPRGAFVGMISLDDPRDVTRVTGEDLSTIEILAADIAVALENTTLQKQLFRSEKLAGMGQLVAGVAHELNNPLTAVLGYTEMLADRMKDPVSQRELEIMRRESLRMKRIIENLQRFSRQQPVERRPVQLANVVGDVIKLRSYDIHSRGIQVVAEVQSELPNIVADEGLMNQVLLNVLNNAMDAVESSDEKRIVIDARQQGQHVLLRVMDSGPGFADPTRVFDPFFTTKAPGKGTGLGLSICYGIVKEHGGDITANNMQPRGACVSIHLPVVPVGVSVGAD